MVLRLLRWGIVMYTVAFTFYWLIRIRIAAQNLAAFAAEESVKAVGAHAGFKLSSWFFAKSAIPAQPTPPGHWDSLAMVPHALIQADACSWSRLAISWAIAIGQFAIARKP